MGQTLELYIETKEGDRVPVDIGLNPLVLNNEKFILCSIHNITHSKNVEKNLVEQSHYMRVIIDIINAIARENDFKVALKHCLTIICTALNWDIGHIFLQDEEKSEQFIPSNIWFLNDQNQYQRFYDETMNFSFAYGIGLPGRVLATNAPVWIEEISQDKNFSRQSVCQSLGIHSAIGFPVHMGKNIIAIVELFSKQIKKEESNNLLAINILMSQISHFIENQDIQEKNKKLTMRFKLAVASGKIGVWEYNFNKNKLIWDENMFQVYGLDPRYFNGTLDDWEKTLHPDDRFKVIQSFKLAAAKLRPFFC